MALRIPLSAAPAGNVAMTPAYSTANNTAFVLGTNMQDFHVAAGLDEAFVEVCNIDTVPHQLVGAFHQGAIASPDDLFYQTIPPQSGWIRILASDIMLSGLGLAAGVPAAGDLYKLNFRGHVNRIIDSRKLGLSAAGTYNKNIKIAGTNVGTATLLHSAYNGTDKTDEVYVRLTNTSANPVLATLCVGGTTNVCQVPVWVPAQNGWLDVLVGECLNNNLAVSAFAATANVLNARGWANRVS